jgi:general secretion pathway protein L
MAEILFIRLGSQNQDAVSWLIFNALEQEIIASGELANAEQLTLLTEKAQQRVVKVFVPGSDVLLKRLTVPTKSQRAMRSAVPYMLEDELAQDVDELFFAYANISSDNSEHNCFVAITQREQMQLWLSWLADADIKTKSIQPDVLAMPYVNEPSTHDQWSAIALNPDAKSSQIIIRQGQWQGFVLDSEAWQFTLQSRLLAARTLNTSEAIKAEQGDIEPVLTINAYSVLPRFDAMADTDAERDAQSLIQVVHAQEELPLALLAQQSSTSQHSTFNLLQDEFKIKEQRSPYVTSWLWAAGFAACALLCNVGYKSAKLWQLSNQQIQIEAQIIDRYQQTFPNAKRVRIGTIKSQLTRELSQLGGGSEQVGFLSMLSQVQPAFAKVPALKPESLKFDGKRQELRVQAIADDYQHFERFKNALNLANLTVKQGTQNNQGEQVTGSFSIVSKEGS